MKRIHPISIITPEMEKVFSMCPVNVTRSMLTGGINITEKFLEYGLAFGDGILADHIREGVILRVAYAYNCEYEVLHHLPIAMQTEITSGDLEALKNSLPEEIRLKAAINYVDSILNEKVSNEKTFSQLKEQFSEKEIVLLTLLVGHYIMSAIFIKNCGVELDDKPVSTLYKR